MISLAAWRKSTPSLPSALLVLGPPLKRPNTLGVSASPRGPSVGFTLSVGSHPGEHTQVYSQRVLGGPSVGLTAVNVVNDSACLHEGWELGTKNRLQLGHKCKCC